MNRLALLVIPVVLAAQAARAQQSDRDGDEPGPARVVIELDAPPVPPAPPPAPPAGAAGIVAQDGRVEVRPGRHPALTTRRGARHAPARTSRPPVPPSLSGLGVPTELLAEADAPTPAWFADDTTPTTPDSRGLITIKGRPSASPERAEKDAFERLDRKLAEWLRPEVDRKTWSIPDPLVDAMIVDRHVQPVVMTLGEPYTLYVAGYRVDVSPARKQKLVEAHRREMVVHRLGLLGGGLGFVLVCLAALAGYIRADEATKGYYTNRLRLLAAAGVGVAGAAIYRVLA